MKAPRKKLYWTALSQNDRLEDIESIKRTISDQGGSIVHFSMFSDMALGLAIEIDEADIVALYRAFEAFLKLVEEAPQGLDSEGEEEWLIRMHVSFGKGTGDMKLQIPMVPG